MMNDYLIQEVNLEGYQVITSQFFEKQIEPMVTMTNVGFTFNIGVLEALQNCEAVQILINEKTQTMIVKPVSSAIPEAITWKKPTKSQPFCKLDCPALIRRIIDVWDLNKNYRYRASGRQVRVDQKVMLLFDFCEPQIFDGLKRIDTIK